MNDAAEIDIQHALPVFERTEERGTGLDAGVVHRDMNGAEALRCSLRQHLDILQTADIGRHRQHGIRTARRRGHDLRCRLLQPLAGQISQHDIQP